MANEQPIPQQQDAVSTSPGGGIRAINANVIINGVPTNVLMQVVGLANPDGTLIDGFEDRPTQALILEQLVEIRKLLAMIANVPNNQPLP